MTSGRVQKLTPEETRRLVQTLNLSAHWLATGDGPMFNTMGGERLGDLLTQVKLASTRLGQIKGLRPEEARAATAVVTGVHSGSLQGLREGLAAGAEAALSDAERSLLASYRRCSPEGQSNLVQMAGLLAGGASPHASVAAKPAVKKRAAGAGQAFHGQVGQAVNVSGDLNQPNVRFFSDEGKK